MSTFFFGGVMFVGLIFFAKRGKGGFRLSSENRSKHQDKIDKIEQEIQQARDKALRWGFPW